MPDFSEKKREPLFTEASFEPIVKLTGIVSRSVSADYCASLMRVANRISDQLIEENARLKKALDHVKCALRVYGYPLHHVLRELSEADRILVEK